MGIVQYVCNRWRLSKVRRKEARLSKEYDRSLRDKIKAGMDPDEAAREVGGEFKAEFRALHAEMETVISKMWLRRAENLGIQAPADEKHWVHLKYSEHDTLSEDGRIYLRNLIRDEAKYRREVFGFWFNVATVLLSLVVAIIALLKS